MYFEFVILIIAFSFFRKNLRGAEIHAKWERLFYGGLMLSVALLVLHSTSGAFRVLTQWLAHALLVAVIYAGLTRKEFKPVLSFIYAIIPLAVINIAESLTKLVSPSFHDEWENYFDTANIFSYIWLGVMFFISNRQQKAIELERLRTAEKEKQVTATASLNDALEVQVAERTRELTIQKEELQHALNDLKATQSQLIHAEKMASLGQLTAGIAHEIQNPLNFINNFSDVNRELLQEMNEEMQKGNLEEARHIANNVMANQEKILHHGRRADSIVKGMLMHSRNSTGQKEPTDINKLADEYFRLSYHGIRAKEKSFNAQLVTHFDESLSPVNIVPQEIGRVILNLITNAFYAVGEKARRSDSSYHPTVTITTRKVGSRTEVLVKDNGGGIPQDVVDKIFQPFFTTKPTGQGTGLGLSLSYDIVRAHGGELKLNNKPGEGAEFVVSLPGTEK